MYVSPTRSVSSGIWQLPFVRSVERIRTSGGLECERSVSGSAQYQNWGWYHFSSYASVPYYRNYSLINMISLTFPCERHLKVWTFSCSHCQTLTAPSVVAVLVLIHGKQWQGVTCKKKKPSLHSIINTHSFFMKSKDFSLPYICLWWEIMLSVLGPVRVRLHNSSLHEGLVGFFFDHFPQQEATSTAFEQPHPEAFLLQNKNTGEG